MIERIREWFQYECDVNTKTIESLHSVPLEKHLSPEFVRAVNIFGHIVSARRIWLERMGTLPSSGSGLFPTELTLQQASDQWSQVSQHWQQMLNETSEQRLAEVFEYTSLDGRRFQNSVEEICVQLFGHAMYHRGQIAMLVRSAGGQPAITDFIYWCRRPVD